MTDAAKLILQQGSELIFYRAVLANLMGELALMHEDPPVKLGEMTAKLQGLASGLASQCPPAAAEAILASMDALAESCELILSKKEA